MLGQHHCNLQETFLAGKEERGTAFLGAAFHISVPEDEEERPWKEGGIGTEGGRGAM